MLVRILSRSLPTQGIYLFIFLIILEVSQASAGSISTQENKSVGDFDLELPSWMKEAVKEIGLSEYGFAVALPITLWCVGILTLPTAPIMLILFLTKLLLPSVDNGNPP
jgi:hypothetical protein